MATVETELDTLNGYGSWRPNPSIHDGVRDVPVIVTMEKGAVSLPLSVQAASYGSLYRPLRDMHSCQMYSDPIDQKCRVE